MKRITALLMALSLTVALAACGDAGSSGTPATEAPAQATDAAPADDGAEEENDAPADTGAGDITSLNFAYCSASTNDYWTVLQNGVEEAAKEYGINLTTATADEDDVQGLVNLVENAISAGVDCIITAASNPDAFIEVLNRAVDQGITVITVDQDSPNSNRQYFVGTSNYEAGYIAGEAMVELTGGEAEIAMFAGTITASNAVDRMAGFAAAIESSDGMNIVTYEEVKNDVLITMQKTEAVLNGFPEINAFYGVFAYDPLGAAKTIDEMGRGDEFTIIGFDDLDESVELLKKGVIDALIVQQPYEIGRTAVITGVDALTGSPAPLGDIGAEVLVVTAENVNDLY